MGSAEILKILSKGDKLTATEIAELSECSLCAVHFTIRRLLKDVSENIEVRPLTPKEKKERFGRLMGMKINIYWMGE